MKNEAFVLPLAKLPFSIRAANFCEGYFLKNCALLTEMQGTLDTNARLGSRSLRNVNLCRACFVGRCGGADAKVRTHYIYKVLFLYIKRRFAGQTAGASPAAAALALSTGGRGRRREAAEPVAGRIGAAHPFGERKRERACRSAGGEANPFVGKRDQVLFVERADGAFERLLRHFETLGDDFRLAAVGEG